MSGHHKWTDIKRTISRADASKVAFIVMSADGGCHVCSGELIKLLIDAFPDHRQLFRNTWQIAYDMELPEDG